MKRKEREHLKDDPLMDLVKQISEKARPHIKALSIAGIALVVALLGLWGFQAWRSHRLTADNEGFAQATSLLGAQDKSTSEKIEGLKAIGVRGPLTATLPLHIATLYFHEGEYDTALKFLEETDLPAQEPFRSRQSILLARIQAAKGETDKAISTLQSLLGTDEPSSNAPEIMLALGQTQLKAGRTDEAKSTLDKLVADHPATMAAFQARQLLNTQS